MLWATVRDGTHKLYKYNNRSEISSSLFFFLPASRADLYLLQLQDIEPCIMGHCLRHLGFREGDVFREILIKQNAFTVIKASQLLFVQFCIKANNYSPFIHTVFIQCKSTCVCDQYTYQIRERNIYEIRQEMFSFESLAA